MPKNNVTGLITDQEMAFARLVLSGTMTDRQAAEAAGLNPDTAAYTKAQPRVRAYMLEHSAAVREKLVDQETEALRKRNIGRDKILVRLWELAHLGPEATKGSIAGQIKAMSMIVAIEGLILNRRLPQAVAQPASTPLKADIPAPIPDPPPLRQRNQPSVARPFTPIPLSRVPAATGYSFEDLLCQAGLTSPISPEKAFSVR